jgi:hypothetical protein
MVHQYNYYVSGHHPLSCLYLETVLFFSIPVSETGLCLRLQVKPTLAPSIGPTQEVLPEDGERVQSRKRVLKKKIGRSLDKDKTMDNVQKHNICTKDQFIHYMVPC